MQRRRTLYNKAGNDIGDMEVQVEGRNEGIYWRRRFSHISVDTMAFQARHGAAIDFLLLFDKDNPAHAEVFAKNWTYWFNKQFPKITCEPDVTARLVPLLKLTEA